MTVGNTLKLTDEERDSLDNPGNYLHWFVVGGGAGPKITLCGRKYHSGEGVVGPAPGRTECPTCRLKKKDIE